MVVQNEEKMQAKLVEEFLPEMKALMIMSTHPSGKRREVKYGDELFGPQLLPRSTGRLYGFVALSSIPTTTLGDEVRPSVAIGYGCTTSPRFG